MNIHLVWGCDRTRQFETAWIYFLLGNGAIHTTDLWDESHVLPAHLVQFDVTVLVESGLLYLQRNVTEGRVQSQLLQRQRRLDLLSDCTNLIIFHLSDEEGYDGDAYYPLLSPGTVIWRNFEHHRFANSLCRIHNFPIGPRKIFLEYFQNMRVNSLFDKRTFPWTFMGTLWISSSRQLAVSLFLRVLPKGFYYGGRHFGQGIPLDQYHKNLLNSIFGLAPEGDRHLDTFRLWEILCSGCIPLIVDRDNVAISLLPYNFPCPIFTSWKSALKYTNSVLLDPTAILQLRIQLLAWWQSYIFKLQFDILKSAL